MSREHRIDFTPTIMTNVAIAIMTFVTGPLAARLLGPEGRGDLAAIQIWPTFIASIAVLGLPDATAYFSARQPEYARRYVASGIACAIPASLLFMCLSYVAMPTLLIAQSAATIASAQLYALFLIPLQAWLLIQLHALRGRNDLSVWNLLRAGLTVCWLAVILLAALLGRATAHWITMAYLVFLVLLSLLTASVVSRRLKGLFAPEVALLGPMLHYGVRALIGIAPALVNARLGQMLLAAFFEPRSLGLYVVALGWAGALSPILTAMGFALFPRLAAMRSMEGKITLLSQACRTSVVVAASGSLVLCILAPFGIPILFGSDFQEAVWVAVVLTAGSAATGVNTILEEGFRALGRPEALFWSEGAAGVTTVLVLAAFVVPLGVKGAAIAHTAGVVVATGVLLASMQRATGCSLSRLCLPTKADLPGLVRDALVR
jgi:O-antigen/teichoic acid export membrane protein